MVVETTMDSMYLENLDEFVNDEGKIVTYKWLSLTLGVNSNVAKQMLYHFVTNQRDADKGDNLNVTYLVSGVEAGKDEKPETHRVMLVREENLTATKEKLKNVISVHIYSVQKSKLPDMSVLYTTDYDKVKENILSINKYSGIECPAAKIRSSADLEKLQKQNAYQAPPEPTRIPSKYKPNQTKSSPKKDSPGDNKQGGNKASGKGNQIASMFARQTKKSDDDKSKKEEEGKESEKVATKTPPSAGAKKKGGISSFFSKAPAIKKTEPSRSSESSPANMETPVSSIKSEVESPVKTDSTSTSPVKTESQESIKEEDSEQMEVESPPTKKAAKKKQQKIKTSKTSQKRGKTKSTEDEEPLPKRKRIMQLLESDSSGDEENEGEDENPFPPSPPPEPTRIESDSEDDIPPTPQPEAKVDLMKGDSKGKRKKLVDKTFMDEDGFFVTKKEYEYVSDSGEEEPLPVKEIVSPQKKTSPKSAKTASPKKAETKQASPMKKKQANIMNFFKKK